MSDGTAFRAGRPICCRLRPPDTRCRSAEIESRTHYTTAILQDASVLTTSESNLVSAKAAYEKSRIELDRATGLLLDHSNIDVAEATRGQVTHLPNVPYVVPRQDLNPNAQPTQPQPPPS